MEGHPDNSTPAILGGLVTAVIDGEKVYYVKQEISGHLRFVTFIPDFELKTELARSVPVSYTHLDVYKRQMYDTSGLTLVDPPPASASGRGSRRRKEKRLV